MGDSVVPLDGCSVRSVDPERVTATSVRLIDPDAARSVAAMFRLLGEPGRVRVLYALLEAGELCVCDLAATVEAPESTVSHTLRLLPESCATGARVASSTTASTARTSGLLDLTAEHVQHVDVD